MLGLAPGGTERLVIELVTRLAGRFRMAVCCLDDPGTWGLDLAAQGVPVTALHRGAGFRPSLGSQIARFARAHDASVLHCHHYSPFVYGRLARLWNRHLQVVYTEHGRLSDVPATLKRRMANTVVGRYGGPMFAVSGALRSHLVSEGFSRRLGVIHNGIEIGALPGEEDRRQARAVLHVSDDTILVGTAARLDPVKDLPSLIEAVAHVRRAGTRVALAIIGDGPERVATEGAARQHGVDDIVTLTGYRADVRQLLSGFDIYVNSSISEGVSLTILEAMAAGLPVVATNVGGTPEVVLDNVTGVLVPARSPAALAEALLGLAQFSERRARMGRAGRGRVSEMFTIERMVEDYARVYARMGRR